MRDQINTQTKKQKDPRIADPLNQNANSKSYEFNTGNRILKQRTTIANLKILIVHTHYQIPGGEDVVTEQEFEMLKQHHNVTRISFKNKSGLRGGIQFLSSIWNVSIARKLKKEIKQFAPDIVHIHNWNFATGPIIVRVAKKLGASVVLTLHNYRLLCPSATLLHNGHMFTDSITSNFPWTAVKLGVYRNSSIITFWLAFITWFHKKIGTWSMVDKYIVLTEFAKNIYVQSTLRVPPEKFQIKPNFINSDEHSTNNEFVAPRSNRFLYIGRLSAEKGIHIMLKAFTNSGYKLEIAGDGPLRNEVLKACAIDPNISYCGFLDRSSVQKKITACSILVYPSIWFEGMPMAILESFALGTPVIASNLGAMTSIIKHQFDGLHFHIGDVDDLRRKIKYWQEMPENEKMVYRSNAYSDYENYYTEKRNLKLLQNIYIANC